MGFEIRKKSIVKSYKHTTITNSTIITEDVPIIPLQISNPANLESSTSRLEVVKKGRATSYSAPSLVIYPKKKPSKQPYKPSNTTTVKDVPVVKTPIYTPDNLQSFTSSPEVAVKITSTYSAPLIIYPKKKPINKITVGTMNSSTLRKNKTVILEPEPVQYRQRTINPEPIAKEIFIAEYTRTFNIKEQNSSEKIAEAPYKKGNASTITIPEFEIVIYNN